jgi:hypothetical protein
MTNDAAPDVYHRPMLRGEFLKHSLLLMIVGASCLLRPGRRALAADNARSSKPSLTEENLNQFIAELRKGLPPDSEALKTRATRDWRALLREQFTLTSTQKRALEALPKATVQQVQEAIRQAIHTNTAFVVRAVAAEGAAPPTERLGGGTPTPSPTRTEKARVAEWSKPDAVVCTKSTETYECTVKAGVVC